MTMKRIPTIVLSVLLAAAVISGLVLYGRYQNATDALLSKEKEMISLDERINRLNDEISSLQDSGRKDAEKSLEELGRAKAHISKILSQLESANSRIETLTDELGKKDGKIGELRQSFSNAEKDRGAIEAQLSHLQSSHETAVSNLREEIHTRDRRIVELEKHAQTATDQVLTLKEDVAENLREIEALRGRLSYLKKQKNDVDVQSAELKANHEAAVSELERQNADWGAMIADLRKRSKDILSQMSFLQEEVAKERRETEALEISLSDLENRREAAEASLEQLKSAHQAKLSSLQEEVRLRDTAVEALAKKFQNAASEVRALKDKLEKRQTEMEELRGRLTEIEKQRSTVEGQLNRHKSTHEAELTDLREQIKRRDTKIAQLEPQLEEEKNRGTSLQQEILKRQNEAEAFQQSMESIEKQKAALEAQVERLKSTHEDTVSRLNSEIQGRDAMIRDFRKKMKDLTSELLLHKEALAKRQDELETLQSSLSDLLGQKGRLITQIDALKSAHDSIVTDLKGEILNKQVTLEELAEKLSITFVDRILFDFGKATITPKGKDILRKVGEALRNAGAKQIRVVGHTDNKLILPEHRYKFPSNWELSAARAAAVIRFFQNDIGIDPRNMEAVGQSFYRPIATNETEEGRSRNRRVAIIIAPRLE